MMYNNVVVNFVTMFLIIFTKGDSHVYTQYNNAENNALFSRKEMLNFLVLV